MFVCHLWFRTTFVSFVFTYCPLCLLLSRFNLLFCFCSIVLLTVLSRLSRIVLCLFFLSSILLFSVWPVSCLFFVIFRNFWSWSSFRPLVPVSPFLLFCLVCFFFLSSSFSCPSIAQFVNSSFPSSQLYPSLSVNLFYTPFKGGSSDSVHWDLAW